MQRPDVIRGFKIKTIMNYHCIPNRIAKIKKLKIPKAGEDEEQQETHPLRWECKMVNQFETQSGNFLQN